MIPPLAHAAHWILYLAPVAVVLAAVVAGALRERRRRDPDGGGDRTPGAGEG